ncbi:hypothetical protein SNEBB_010698 [Seison nebaliae]|nr:hypothetical protein SNEBB_010698 [Seison nebaliae]
MLASNSTTENLNVNHENNNNENDIPPFKVFKRSDQAFLSCTLWILVLSVVVVIYFGKFRYYVFKHDTLAGAYLSQHETWYSQPYVLLCLSVVPFLISIFFYFYNRQKFPENYHHVPDLEIRRRFQTYHRFYLMVLFIVSICLAIAQLVYIIVFINNLKMYRAVQLLVDCDRPHVGECDCLHTFVITADKQYSLIKPINTTRMKIFGYSFGVMTDEILEPVNGNSSNNNSSINSSENDQIKLSNQLNINDSNPTFNISILFREQGRQECKLVYRNRLLLTNLLVVLVLINIQLIFAFHLQWNTLLQWRKITRMHHDEQRLQETLQLNGNQNNQNDRFGPYVSFVQESFSQTFDIDSSHSSVVCLNTRI